MFLNTNKAPGTPVFKQKRLSANLAGPRNEDRLSGMLVPAARMVMLQISESISC